MERMEVDQCAGAAGSNGGGVLRRSNSAPMITSVSDGMTVFSSNTSARYRRSSVSVNPSCPSRTLAFSPFSLYGGVESDGPPKKLFVAGVTDPAHITSCTVSVSQSADSPSSAACPSPQNIALSLSPPSPFTSQHPSI
ncbi:protein FAM122A-like [Silurus meridionalis]|nr:protein FAM122A-like [Silurus meridionalis]